MSFKFFCTDCGQKIEAETEHIGQNVYCPNCGILLAVDAPKPIQRLENTDINKSWHYLSCNKTLGPFDENIIVKLIKEGEINGDTYVWCSDMNDWDLACKTSLNKNFTKQRIDGCKIQNTTHKISKIFNNKFIFQRKTILGGIKTNITRYNKYTHFLIGIVLFFVIGSLLLVNSGRNSDDSYKYIAEVNKQFEDFQRKTNPNDPDFGVKLLAAYKNISEMPEFDKCPNDYKLCSHELLELISKLSEIRYQAVSDESLTLVSQICNKIKELKHISLKYDTSSKKPDLSEFFRECVQADNEFNKSQSDHGFNLGDLELYVKSLHIIQEHNKFLGTPKEVVISFNNYVNAVEEMINYTKSVPSYEYEDFVKMINNNMHGIYDPNNARFGSEFKKIGKKWQESWESFLLVAGRHDDELKSLLNHRN